MKKKMMGLLILAIALLMIPAHAAARTPDVMPRITFNGTEATCTVTITGDMLSDEIFSTMELWQGSTFIDDWSGSDTFMLELEGTATVQTNKTYKLVVNYSINDEEQDPVTIYKINR